MYHRLEVRDGALFLKKRGALFELRIHGICKTKKCKNPYGILPAHIDYNLVNIGFAVFPPRALKPIKEIEGQARRVVRRWELPIGFQRLHYLPKDCIMKVIEELNTLEPQYKAAAVENLILPYDTLVEEIMERNPELPKNLIPSQTDLSSRFYFDWTFFELSPPDPGYGVLPKRIYEKIKKEYEEKMDRACMTAVVGLKEEILDMLIHAVERLGYTIDDDNMERKKIFKNSMVEHIKQFCADFRSRDIFQDEALNKVIIQLESLLEGDVEDLATLLRKKDNYRRDVRQELSKIKTIAARGILAEQQYERASYIPADILKKALDEAGD